MEKDNRKNRATARAVLLGVGPDGALRPVLNKGYDHADPVHMGVDHHGL